MKGFTIFLATLVASLSLAIGLAIYDITVRQLDLSTTVIQSEYAIYAADSGVECALYWDAKYGGSGSAFAGAQGGGGAVQKRVYLTTTTGTTRWTVPDDWNDSSNTIEVIGGGGAGGAGWGTSSGGGGSYAKVSNRTFTPGNQILYTVGAGGVYPNGGGQFTMMHNDSGAAMTVCASGGIGGGGEAGGNCSVGDVIYAGGQSASSNSAGAGGGGAGGPGGAGAAGATQHNANRGGTGGTGGGGAGGAGGTGVTNGSGNPGGTGTEWDGSHGSGGGGGGGSPSGGPGGRGGNYGGGGGQGGMATAGADGAPGIIVITYTGSTAPGGPPSSGIMCGAFDVAAKGTPPIPFAPQPTGWTPWAITENGNAATTTFTLTFPPYSYCAKVEIGKVTNNNGSISTTILSHGYNTCASNAQNQLERLLKVNY